MARRERLIPPSPPAIRARNMALGVGVSLTAGTVLAYGLVTVGAVEISLLYAVSGLFAANAIVASLWGRRRRWVSAAVLGVYGASFWCWWYPVALIGGTTGVPHAIITAALLAACLGSIAIGAMSLVALVAAWGVAFSANVVLSLMGVVALAGSDALLDEAVILWSVLMSGSLLTWTATTGPPVPPRRLPGQCVACGYDLGGLVGPVCPECGLEFPTLLSWPEPPHDPAPPICATCRYPLEGVRGDRCPECGEELPALMERSSLSPPENPGTPTEPSAPQPVQQPPSPQNPRPTLAAESPR